MSTLRERLLRETWTTDADENVLFVYDALCAFSEWLDENGLVCVPREATGAMTDAVWSISFKGEMARETYAAMIAAAPDPLGEK